MAALENIFSWSASRASAFERCAREYWWLYYGAWGGWNADAPAETRQAYVLKNLTTRWAWVGSRVHEAIEDLLRRRLRAEDPAALAFGETDFDPEAEVEAMTTRMREQYAESRAKGYRRWPKRSFGLVEHEYDDPVPAAEWKAMSERAREALRGFLSSEVFREIGATDPRTWLPIEELAQFELEGTPIWVALDFARRREDGGVDIYDWKTGAIDPEGNRLQVVCYALFVQARHGVPADRVRTHLVYLGPRVEVHTLTPTAEDLESARRSIRESVAAMRSRLADPAKNQADRAAFPMTEDLARCRVCNFRRLCGR